jgi:GTP diphosphokinase / guanosine-3',5'-bis(diphosphate) 3'-diphosphatase
VASSADAGPLARNPRGRRLRGLVARGAHAPAHDAIEQLLRAHRAAHPRADLAMLRHAYEVAELLHQGQRRHSGEPLITHPLAVVTIPAERIDVDATTLAPILAA